MNSDVTNPPAASGDPVFQAVLKSCASDFCVSENLSIEFSDSGEHLYLLIEKSSMNTDEVLTLLERSFDVKSSDIGWCGMKDRHALTTQWFSIRTTNAVALFENSVNNFNQRQMMERADGDGFVKSLRILDSHRHSRKLRRGAHDGNRFGLVLRQIKAMDNTAASALQSVVADRINTLKEFGFPNYIGAQRFGQDARNIHRARQWFARPKKRCSRVQRSLWLSSARSALFNVVCAERVRDGSWQRLLEGEPATLNGSRSFFLENNPQGSGADKTLEARLAVFDIHPSAPWWGRGRTPAEGACAVLEARLLAPYQDLCEGLERAGLDQERRALRTQAENLSHQWLGDDALELSFSLPPGVFATTLLRELCSFSEPQR